MTSMSSRIYIVLFAETIQKANEQARNQANEHRREPSFQLADLVWIHIKKERFSSKKKSKLILRSDGCFEVLEKICPNAYKVDLPGECGVFTAFNVANLNPYYDEDEQPSCLRENSFQEGELIEFMA